MDEFARLEWIAALQADRRAEEADMAERAQRRLAGELDPAEQWRRLQPPPPKPAPVTPPPPARAVVRKPMIDMTMLERLADETGANVREAVGEVRREFEGRLVAVEAENADLKARLRSLETALIARAVQSDPLALPAPRSNGIARDH